MSREEDERFEEDQQAWIQNEMLREAEELEKTKSSGGSAAGMMTFQELEELKAAMWEGTWMPDSSDTLNLIEQAQRACALEDTHSGSRREGVIEGLEWVMHVECEGDLDFLQFKIRAEIERRKGES